MPNLYKPTYVHDGEKRESSVWWASAYRDGRRIRFSTGCRDKEAAKAEMHRRLAETSPKLPGKLTLRDLRELVVEDYRRNGNKSTKRVLVSFKALERHFGATRKAARIQARQVVEFVSARLDAGRAPATVNRDLAALRRGFNLAREQGLVREVPTIKALTERNARKGFLRPEQFAKLYRALDADLRPLARVAFVTGWRKGELVSRRWKHVDLRRGWLRLEPGETKNREGRSFPLTEVLLRELEAQHHRACELWGVERPPEDAPLFFRTAGPHKGQRVVRFDAAWAKATKAAGKPDLLFHDLRRSAVRELVRAGVPETVAMRLTGHRTRSVFRRYAIVSEQELLEAADRLNARRG